ncbi:MAG: hypothetical protein ACJ8C4_10020 [Gemmataceae bacterium]
MKARKYILAGLVSLSGVSAVWAQFAPPAAPAIAGPPAAAAAVAPAQPGTLWSFLGISKPQLQECHRQCCAKPCGQFLNQLKMPLVLMSGGLIQSKCDNLLPSPADLADPGAVGAAAKIKADEAGAAARRAAMRYLGTVDCHYWPEAEAALIDGLRGDHNECVRFEAALALGNGCCCTKKTMEALRIASSCVDTDGNPKETSNRVRAAAVAALEHCLACYIAPPVPVPEKLPEGRRPEGEAVPNVEVVPVPPPPPPGIKAGDEAKPQTKIERPVGRAYYAKIDEVPKHLIVEEARKAVEKYNSTARYQAVLAGQNSLVQIVERASATPGSTADANGTRAEVLSPRPQSLWEMLDRQVPSSAPIGRSVTVATAAPPMAPEVAKMPEPMQTPAPMPPAQMPSMVKAEPMPEAKSEVKMMPKEIAHNNTLQAPEMVKPLKPSDIVVSPYGDISVAKPKKVEAPAKLPTAMASETPPLEHKTMKPNEPAANAKPATTTEKTPTPVAKRALQVFGDATPASVREETAAGLTAADMASCPDLATALVAVASGSDQESTRKAAIKALVRTDCATPEVMQALEKLTDDPSAGIRVEAAIGMARLKLKAGKN